MSTTASHHNNFDLIRLIAAMQVLVMHTIGHLKLPVTHWEVWRVATLFPGVAVFFVVSGFLIASTWRTSDGALWPYVRNRILRVYPALVVNVCLVLALLALGGSLRFWPDTEIFWRWLAVALTTGTDYLAQQTIGNMHVGGGHYPFLPTGALWTIPIELSFYLLVPLVFHPAVKERWLALSMLCCFTVSLILFITIEQKAFPFPIFIGLYLWMFLLGAAIQVYWEKLRPVFEGRALYWLIGYLAMSYAFTEAFDLRYSYMVKSIPSVLTTVVLAGVVISCAFTLPNLSRVLRRNDLSVCSKMSVENSTAYGGAFRT